MAEQPNEKDNDSKLIETLRAEAQEVKDCFTRFSFQSLAISTAVLGFVASRLIDQPTVAFAAVPVVIMLFVVARIGTYKYGTANRNFGYELHLDRAIRHPGDELKDASKVISWEEAMLAWRIVQATVFAQLYEQGGWKTFRQRMPNLMSILDKDKRTMVVWHVMPAKHVKAIGEQNEQKKSGSGSRCEITPTYSAGSYLRSMLAMLYIVAVLAIMPLFFATFSPGAQQKSNMVGSFNPGATNDVAFSLGIGILARTAKENLSQEKSFEVGLLFLRGLFLLSGIVLFVITICRRWLDFQRCGILEGGMLSIQGCAVMWDIVVLAHSYAIEGPNSNSGSVEYITRLSKEAETFCELIRNNQPIEQDLPQQYLLHHTGGQ